MKLNRRQVLQALGLGAMSAVTANGPLAFAGGSSPPTRIVFFVQPHGHVPNAWTLPLPGAPADAFVEQSLIDSDSALLPPVLRALHPFRERLLVVEGISHTSMLFDIAEIKRAGTGDLNNHSIGVAGLLTGTRAHQSGSVCSGGSRSLDQELAQRTSAPGRFGSRVYGFDYVPNQTVTPFSFLGPGQASPMVSDPQVAFADLLGYAPAKPGTTPTRDQLFESLRPSVLEAAGREYEAMAPRLDEAGRKRLEDHKKLIADLEASLGAGVAASCKTTFDALGHQVTQFMKLIKIAFACDLTRVVTFVAPVPQCPEFGYPAADNVHTTYAHASVNGNTACGAAYDPNAERAMTDLGVWYANHFVTLMRELDSVVEGSGTLLDHTLIVWVTELATPTHQHQDGFTILAGGGNANGTGSFFKTGRYARYPRTFTNPIAGFSRCGPAHNRLHVSLLRAMGQSDSTFGLTEAKGADGSTIPLVDPLLELHRS